MTNRILDEEVDSEFVEMDPTGRYGRYSEALGKGSCKTLYRAFDEIEGIEVAWNQVKMENALKTPEDFQRLCSELHLLKTLKHRNIIKFYASWIDTKARNINFVTEMFTSGSLRQYREKHKRVGMKAVKNWARQILRGLLYLHSHDPPIIHRDLKCDNIFVNGNQAEVKIGDLGLAATLRKSQSARTLIGTPEFMAPELYDEDYNELVDIYAFGMCILEMLTLDYPYSECSNTVQIYKKVTSGKKPQALYKVKDPQARQFIEKCLASASRRLSAGELLMDPFLSEHISENSYSIPRPIDITDIRVLLKDGQSHNMISQNQDYHNYPENAVIDLNDAMKEPKVLPLPSSYVSDDNPRSPRKMDFTVKGKERNNHTIHLRLPILDSTGRIRNICFPFDIKEDTAMSVASEMVAELDLTDQDVTKIADMIDEEILASLPRWKAKGASTDDCQMCYGLNDGTHKTRIQSDCLNSMEHKPVSAAASESSLVEFERSHCNADKSGTRPCTQAECATIHGRFEEVTFELNHAVEYSSFIAEDAPPISSCGSSDFLHQDWICEQDLLSPGFSQTHHSEIPHGGYRSLDFNHNKTCAKEGFANNFGDTHNIHLHKNSGSSRSVCNYSGQRQNESKLVPNFNPISVLEEDELPCRELRLLAITHQQELRELQRRHELSLKEIESRLQRQTVPRHSVLDKNHNSCTTCPRKTDKTSKTETKSPISRNLNTKLSASPTTKTPSLDLASTSKRPSSYSPSSNPMAHSTNSSPNQKLWKTDSISPHDYQSVLNSLWKKVKQTRSPHKAGTVEAENLRYRRLPSRSSDGSIGRTQEGAIL